MQRQVNGLQPGTAGLCNWCSGVAGAVPVAGVGVVRGRGAGVGAVDLVDAGDGADVVLARRLVRGSRLLLSAVRLRRRSGIMVAAGNGVMIALKRSDIATAPISHMVAGRGGCALICATDRRFRGAERAAV